MNFGCQSCDLSYYKLQMHGRTDGQTDIWDPLY